MVDGLIMVVIIGLFVVASSLFGISFFIHLFFLIIPSFVIIIFLINFIREGGVRGTAFINGNILPTKVCPSIILSFV